MRPYIKTAALAALTLLAACSDKLEVTPPNSITDEQIQTLLNSGDESKIELVLGGLANALGSNFCNNKIVDNASYLTGYSFLEGQMVMRCYEGNDMVAGDKVLSSSLFGAYEYQLGDVRSTASQYNFAYWIAAYKAITNANKLLNYLEDDQMVGGNSKLKTYKAQALTVRAYFYQYLMQNYQDAYLLGGKEKPGVPVYTHYDPAQEYQPRWSSTDTYQLISGDLAEAVRLFTEAGVEITDDVYDIDLGMALFVQARVALWTGDWGTCASACQRLLSLRPALIDEAHYGNRVTRDGAGQISMAAEADAFLNKAVNPETLFGWDKSKSYGVFGGYMNIFSESFQSTSSYGPTKDVYPCIDQRLYDMIAPSDYRRDCFARESLGNYSYPRQGTHHIPAYANLKFAATTGLGTDNRNDAGLDDFSMMRTSEALLMKAEAEAASGQEQAAKATLDRLLAARTRAGQPTLTTDNYPTMQGMTLMQKIQLQWRIEMWGEGGLEYYNNKRWGIPVDRTGSENHVEKNARLSVADMTLQIPEDEMTYNPLCQQN